MAVPPDLATNFNLTDTPVTPRPSATVLLLRGRNPWELLLMHRPWGSDFAPGAYVFPGGSVHEEDAMWEDEIKAAGVRERVEEIGILLARRGGNFARAKDCVAVRTRVEAGHSFFASLHD